jgi:hypothetical protein
VANWEQAVRSFGAEPFVTQLMDVEDYLVSPAYLAEKNPNFTELEAADLLSKAVQAAQADAIENYTNGRLDVLRKLGVRNINHGQLAGEAAKKFAADPRSMIKGKRLRTEIRRIFQAERGANLRSEGTSAELSEPLLAALAARKRKK